jgi:hypothetical protein
MKTTRDPETYKIKHKKRPESEWATHYDPDIRIISDELWAAAQARRELLCEKSGSRKAGGMARSQASRGYLFSGLLHCGCCGSSMVLKNGPGPRGSYHCTSAIRKTGCDNLQKIRRQPLERYLIDQIAATIRSVANFNDVKKLFMTELATQLKRQQEMVENAGQNEDTLLKERVKITSDLENLAEEIADYGGSDTIRSVMRRKEARLSIIAKELHQVQTPIRQVPEDEVDAFLKKEFEDLADLLLGDPIRSKLELQKRVNKLTLTPIKHDGAPAYMITGDIDLFSDHEAVLLGRNRDNTPKQHQFAIKLDGFVLRLDEHGVVTACSSIPLSAVEAENVLSKAA